VLLMAAGWWLRPNQAEPWKTARVKKKETLAAVVLSPACRTVGHTTCQAVMENVSVFRGGIWRRRQWPSHQLIGNGG
jgi:hypothetical protein